MNTYYHYQGFVYGPVKSPKPQGQMLSKYSLVEWKQDVVSIEPRYKWTGEALEDWQPLIEGKDFEIQKRLMSLNAKQGYLVTPVYKDGSPWGGYDNDQNKVEKHCKENGIYEVESVDVGNWSSTVDLKGIPKVSFNTVSFYEFPFSATPIKEDSHKQPLPEVLSPREMKLIDAIKRAIAEIDDKDNYYEGFQGEQIVRGILHEAINQ